MNRFVWDTSAIVNLKEDGDNTKRADHSLYYSEASTFHKVLTDGFATTPRQFIFPATTLFETQATVSATNRDRSQRGKRNMLPEFYLLGERDIVYPIDQTFVKRAAQAELFSRPGFDRLKGGDLIIACVAYLEDAYLVTRDKDFRHVEGDVRVINLATISDIHRAAYNFGFRQSPSWNFLADPTVGEASSDGMIGYELSCHCGHRDAPADLGKHSPKTSVYELARVRCPSCGSLGMTIAPQWQPDLPL
ncbi:MAG TPA: PIN domain-containing protein [Hyphomonadaceae bacterium]|nr:PIN domain-containing protein [Hyphomonadaceae bacterium]